MDPATFTSTLRGVQELNATEGPSRNIFEPKFQARTQAEALLEAVTNKMKLDPSPRCQIQIARCLLFIGYNMMETEEEKEGLEKVLTAHSLVMAAIRGELVDVDKLPQSAINDILSTEDAACNDKAGFAYTAVYVEILNTFGLFFAERDEKHRIDDALRVLRLAEQQYLLWKPWFLKQEDACSIEAVELDEKGYAKPIEGKDADLIHTMESHYTSTLFSLAQVFTLKQDVHEASKYCHRTMVQQLRSKKEFSRKDWATNALQLSSYYTSVELDGCALHCLNAGKHIMPTEPADDETLGVVAWAFAKFYKGRLRRFSEYIQEGSLPQIAKEEKPLWWEDFPLPIDGPARLPPIQSVEDARREFTVCNRYLNEATEYYRMDTQCPDHIAILQDKGQICSILGIFEKDMNRKISLNMRRHEFLHNIPNELNPQAYLTLIRQLWFDLGDINTDILDMRIAQKRESLSGSFSDKKMNLLHDRAMGCFEAFIDTFKTEDGSRPKKLEKDLQIPYFRAMMRRAGLQTKRFHRDARGEYDTVGKAIERYDEILAFVASNKLEDEASISTEIRMAKEMKTLLPGKQKEIRNRFA